jgi:hypothetical protein
MCSDQQNQSLAALSPLRVLMSCFTMLTALELGTGKKPWHYRAGRATLNGSHGNGTAIARLARYWHGTGKVARDAR